MSRAQPPSSKKQQSISSFFSKSTSSPKPSLQSDVSSGKQDSPGFTNGSAKHQDDLLSAEEDLVVPIRRGSGRSKRTIGSHKADGEEEDNDDLQLPATKRLRRDSEAHAFTALPSPGTSSVQQTTLSVKEPYDSTLTSTTANASKSSKVTDRTSRYLFSSSPQHEIENIEPDDSTLRQREKLHQRFVKKLGRPDSIAEIKRRNWQAREDDEENEEDEEAAAAGEEEAVKPTAKGRKTVAAKKGASKLTPMEKQVLEIKRSHMDTVLVVEVGYKYRFFGEDARIAAKELSIVCIPGKMRYDEHPSEAHIDRFASASIPVHRLHVHVKRLVAAGHKVGVVRQLETAALKAAGDNRNAPFVRKLTNLYTKGTYIDDVEGLESPVEGPSGGAPATGYLLCITETNAKGWGNDEKVHVGILAVQPATGDVIYDDFEDGFMRSEIETRLLHIAPCEFLIVGDLSKSTEKLVQHLSGSKTNVFGDKVRVERIEKSKTMAAQSYSEVSNFYAGQMRPTGTAADEVAGNMLDKILGLPENVTICLSAMINHMKEYGFEHVFDLTKYFQPFSARSHMLLNGTTLTSLEIYQNQTDHTEKGSLFWTLDRTQTRFGKRLLRKWVGRPLLDKARLEERIAAVEELKDGEGNANVQKLKGLLAKVKSDLEKSLIRIYYGKVC